MVAHDRTGVRALGACGWLVGKETSMDRWNHWTKVLVTVTAVLFLVVAAGCGKKPKPGADVTTESTPVEETEGTGTGEASGPMDEPQQPVAAEIEDVFFDYDKHHLRGDARSILEANARVLKADPAVSLVLEGHCDERGTVEYNLALGERRAQSVRSYLEQLGIDPSRLRTVSYGEERPFAMGHDESSWSKNRRVHFVKR
jgi:peptidoglycan-associated lipoprotein